MQDRMTAELQYANETYGTPGNIYSRGFFVRPAGARSKG